MATPAQISQFYGTYGPYATQAGQALGVDPSIIAAQWALESNYGLSAPGNNLAGIQPGGVEQSYASPQAFEQAYVNTIANNFPNAVGAGTNAGAFVSGLQTGTKGAYFTADPTTYLNSVTSIANANPVGGGSGLVPVYDSNGNWIGYERPTDTPTTDAAGNTVYPGITMFPGQSNSTGSVFGPNSLTGVGPSSGAAALSWIEELAIRALMVLVGIVLIGGGLYIAGVRAAGASTIGELAGALTSPARVRGGRVR